MTYEYKHNEPVVEYLTELAQHDQNNVDEIVALKESILNLLTLEHTEDAKAAAGKVLANLDIIEANLRYRIRYYTEKESSGYAFAYMVIPNGVLPPDIGLDHLEEAFRLYDDNARASRLEASETLLDYHASTSIFSIVEAYFGPLDQKLLFNWPDLNSTEYRPAEYRPTFTISDGFEAIRDDQGRATGEVQPISGVSNDFFNWLSDWHAPDFTLTPAIDSDGVIRSVEANFGTVFKNEQPVPEELASPHLEPETEAVDDEDAFAEAVEGIAADREEFVQAWLNEESTIKSNGLYVENNAANRTLALIALLDETISLARSASF